MSKITAKFPVISMTFPSKEHKLQIIKQLYKVKHTELKKKQTKQPQREK